MAVSGTVLSSASNWDIQCLRQIPTWPWDEGGVQGVVCGGDPGKMVY